MRTINSTVYYYCLDIGLFDPVLPTLHLKIHIIYSHLCWVYPILSSIAFLSSLIDKSLAIGICSDLMTPPK